MDFKKNLLIFLTVILIANPLAAQNTWADYVAMAVNYGQKIYEKREIILWGAVGFFGYSHFKKGKEIDSPTKQEYQQLSSRVENLEKKPVKIEDSKTASISADTIQKTDFIDLQNQVTALKLKNDVNDKTLQTLTEKVEANSKQIIRHWFGFCLLAKQQLNQEKGLAEMSKLIEMNIDVTGKMWNKLPTEFRPVFSKNIAKRYGMRSEVLTKTNNLAEKLTI